MPEFSNAQWGAQFVNTTTGAAFAALGTTVGPTEILEDALNAYNKAETAWNNTASSPPFLNSVAGPTAGQVILDGSGQPAAVPLNYSVNLLKNFTAGKATPRTSTTII